jgi:hypothetical protein
MQISWIATKADDTIAALSAEGAEIEKRRPFDPMTTIAVVAAGTILVKALVRLYQDIHYRGVIIDATRDPIQIREMPEWPRQQALVITAKGPQLFEISDPKSADADLRDLIKLVGHG